MAGAGGVRPLRVDALRQLLHVEPPVVRRTCRTCSRLHREPLAALRVDGATVERACEATGSLSSRQCPRRIGPAAERGMRHRVLHSDPGRCAERRERRPCLSVAVSGCVWTASRLEHTLHRSSVDAKRC